MESGGQLAETGIERQGQGGQQCVIGTVFQIAGHTFGPGNHIAMRKHHALRFAGAARSVEDSRNVIVDDAMPGRVRHREQFAPAANIQPVDSWQGIRGIQEHNVLQVAASGKCTQQQLEALRGGDQHAHIAVAQDVADLFGFQQRVKWYEYSTGGRCAKAGDHRLEALLQVDGHALPAGQPQAPHTARETSDRVCKFGKIQGRLAVSQCWR